MAKEDFCFTYYDGDAARDMAHMNRLERGGYSDIIVSQRKFGRLSLAFIKKTLGSDFDVVWEAIRVVLKTDDNEKFYIEWLENSLQKMKRQAVKQSMNGKKGGRPKANYNPNDNPTITQIQSQEKPLGNEYGNGNEIEDELDGGAGEDLSSLQKPFELKMDIVLPATALEPAELNQFTITGNRNTEFLKQQWAIFVSERINDPPSKRRNYRDLSDLTSYFLNWVRTKHPKNATNKQTSKPIPGYVPTGGYGQP